MEVTEWTGLESEGLDLIDVSSVDDDFSQLHSSAHELPIYLKLGAADTDELEVIASKSEEGEENTLLPEIMEPKITRRLGKCNLRNSLAWDSAFFTSAGVLDPDELSSMIEGSEKSQNGLPSIEEDARISADSISSLESDNIALETIEAELFKDIRASIQKSGSTPRSMIINGQPTSVGAESRFKYSSNKADLTPKDRAKTNLTLKRQTLSTQEQEKVAKKVLANPQVMKSSVKTGNSSSSLPKPVNQLGRTNSISSESDRNTMLGTNHVKIDNNRKKVGSKASQTSETTARKPFQNPKTLGLGGPCRVIPKPISSRKPSMGSSTATTKRSSSHDSSGSSSSNKGNSPSIPGRRKTDSKVSPNLRGPACLKSSKISSSLSPASSISDWSSESSSSSTINQRSDRSRASLESSSCKSVESDVISASNSKACAADQISTNDSKVAKLPSQTVMVPSARTSCGSSSMKPSGLRLPSPKIGFFDGVKSAVRTPNGSLQSQPSNLPKIRPGNFSPSGSSNKANVGKILIARRASGLGIKPGTQKLTPPKLVQEQSNTSTYDCGDSSDSKGVANCSKEMKVGTNALDKAKCILDPSLDDSIRNETSYNKIGKDPDVHHIKCDLDAKTVGNDHCENQGSLTSSPGLQNNTAVSYQKRETFGNADGSSISISPIPLETSTNRTPFAEKNIIFDTERFDVLKESTIQTAEKISTNISDLEIDEQMTVRNMGSKPR